MNYYIGGFVWDGESQLDRFIKDGIWENGYREERYSELFSKIQVGDLFALKTTFTRGRNKKSGAKGKSYLGIKKIGKVTAIINTYTLHIEWMDYKECELTDIGWYADTLAQIADNSHQNRIFGKITNHIHMKNIIKILENKKQIILTGAPGTGKTHTAKEIARKILGVKTLDECDRFKIIQFHPAYSYEDFVRGIVTQVTSSGSIRVVA